MAKALVIYYSRRGENYTPQGIVSLEKGNTEYAAEHIQKALDADLFEVRTVKPYAENYRQCCMEAVAEAKAKARPQLEAYLDNAGEYDLIFVCYPCWCGTAPMAVFSLLERCDLRGKRILPLCTHEGSGMANSEQDLAQVCAGASIGPGLAVRGHLCRDSESQIADWARQQL